MNDGVSKGQGNSRYLKSNIPASTTLQQLISMLNNGTFPVDFNGINEAGWLQIGTALNKANLFSDQTAAKYPAGTETVDGALGLLGGGVLYENKTISHSTTIGEMPLGYEFEVDGFVFRKVVDNYANTGFAGIYSLSGLAKKNVQGGTNDGYENCQLDAYYSGEYYSSLPEFIRSNMQTASIQVINDSSTTSGPLKTIQRKLFAPAAIELDADADYYSASTKEGTFINGLLELTDVNSFTRTPYNVDTFFAVDDNRQVIINMSRPNSLITPPLLLLKNDLSITIPDTQDIRMTDLLGRLISIPASQIVDGVKIATGSYMGTGTYGKSNPNTLEFPFEPKLVLIGGHFTSYPGMLGNWPGTFLVKGWRYASAFGVFNENEDYGLHVVWGEKSVSWYSTRTSASMTDTYQGNSDMHTYYYVALG